jgi:hypothetical protein
MVRGRWRWVGVAAAVVAGSLVGLPVTRAGATATYRDQIMANGPVAYFRFGEASRGSSVQNEAWTTWNGVPAQPTADWSSSGVTFGTAHSGFDGDTAVTFSGSTPGSATVDTWPFQKGLRLTPERGHSILG